MHSDKNKLEIGLCFGLLFYCIFSSTIYSLICYLLGLLFLIYSIILLNFGNFMSVLGNSV